MKTVKKPIVRHTKYNSKKAVLNMVKSIFKRVFETVKKKPFEIFGFSIVKMLIEAVICAVPIVPVAILVFIGSFIQYYISYRVAGMVFAAVAIIPILIVVCLAILAICATMVLEVGIYKMYLGYVSEGKGKISDLFFGFKSMKLFLRIIGGYWWKMLFIFLWGIIPVAGVFIAIYKVYSYRFSSIILIMKPEVSVKESLEVSKLMTNGKKGSMFLCDLIIAGIVFGVSLIGEVISIIPIIGWILGVPIGIALWVIAIASEIVMYLTTACFYYVLDNGIFEEEILFEEIKDNYFMNCENYENEE